MELRVSISQKLIISFLLLSLISTTIVGLYSYQKAKEALVNRTFDQLISLRIEKKNRLEEFFTQQLNDVKQAGGLPQVNQLVNLLSTCTDTNRKEQLVNQISNLQKSLPAYFSSHSNNSRMILFGSSGTAIYLNNLRDSLIGSHFLDNKDLTVITRIWENLKNNTEPAIKEAIPGIFHEHSTLFVCKSIKDMNQTKIGMIVLEISPESINHIMFENNPHNGLGESGETYLVGNDNFMRSNSRFLKTEPTAIAVNTEAVLDAFRNGSGIKQMPDYRNIPVLSAFNKLDVPGINWVILAEIDVKEAMIPIYSIRNNIIYLMIIISLLLLGSVTLLSSMITAPIKKLRQEAESIAQGNYGKTISQTSNDEIGDLITAFNQMTLQLKEQTGILEQERKLRMASMMDGQEMERQRLSRELHDGLGQLVLAIKMKLERALHAEPETARIIIAETSQHFKSIIEEIRNISNNLMPAVLSEFGLITGLKNLASETSGQSGINVRFVQDTSTESYGKHLDTYLYRLAQEAVINALKHAKASEILISISEDTDNIILLINDNGQGFDAGQKDKLNGNGIPNMKERINLLGGQFSLNSTIGKGTGIKAVIPR